MTEMLCLVCRRTAQRSAVYLEQSIIGETCAKGRVNATRAGNVTDKHGRKRLSIFQEATQEIDYAHTKREKETGLSLPSRGYYREGVRRAGAIRAAGGGPGDKLT